jgi:hypothetical protein
MLLIPSGTWKFFCDSTVSSPVLYTSLKYYNTVLPPIVRPVPLSGHFFFPHIFIARPMTD